MSNAELRVAGVRVVLFVSVWIAAISVEAQPAHDHYDVVILGAGPGGLSAASRVAHGLQGHARVLVVEKRGDLPAEPRLGNAEAMRGTAFARQQVIGMKPQSLRTLEDTGFRLSNGFRAHAVGVGRRSRESGDEPPREGHLLDEMYATGSTHTIRINQLQAALRRHAQQLGVEFAFDTDVTEIASRDDLARLTLQRNERPHSVTARWIIAADGAGSNARTLLGVQQTQPISQGTMVGAWFRGDLGNVIRYQNNIAPGRTGVILSSGGTTYGLFALPPSVAASVAEVGPTSPTAEAHVHSVAHRLLGNRYGIHRIVVDRIQPFEVRLQHATRAVVEQRRTLLAGDAVQTVNPYTGMGANMAIVQGDRAGHTVLRLLQPDITSASRQELLQSYERWVLSGAEAIQRYCIRFGPAFQPARDARDRGPRPYLANHRAHTRLTRHERLGRMSRSVPTLRHGLAHSRR